MRVEDTVRLAEEHGLPHGRYQGIAQVLTSDFLVDFDDPQNPSVAIQAKYSSDLQKPEVIERLELERRYWQEKGIPWYLVTEREISKQAFTNIQWLYPAQLEEDKDPREQEHYAQMFVAAFTRYPDRKLTDIAQELDHTGQLETGQALYWLRQLLSKHSFLFDINRPYRELKPEDMTVNMYQLIQELNHAGY